MSRAVYSGKEAGMVELVFTEIDADNDNGKEWGSEVFLFLEWQLTFDSNKCCGG